MGSDPDALDQAVRLAIYEQFLDTGRAPTVAETADALKAGPEAVEAAYRRLADARAIVLHPGTSEILMANPLSAVPTPFRVDAGGHRLWGNCIWDAMGVVAMLGGDGTVATSCPDCAEPMTLQIVEGALVPASGLVHYAVPALHWWDDIGYT